MAIRHDMRARWFLADPKIAHRGKATWTIGTVADAIPSVLFHERVSTAIGDRSSARKARRLDDIEIQGGEFSSRPLNGSESRKSDSDAMLRLVAVIGDGLLAGRRVARERLRRTGVSRRPRVEMQYRRRPQSILSLIVARFGAAPCIHARHTAVAVTSPSGDRGYGPTRASESRLDIVEQWRR